ncbi:hypothetical protein M3P05_10655 [Sansalvadorimonas sp. 2012CJ34-2]|uniref:Uncharacterized protein n=1 Tax=Parendozoicomonas callyspongiae TaxID=2942213 RepID=A0ABT0PG76_9GAMM|nr:hypothetical protein [Sansalvadorimonas sp. 2012CJ34-2]MCL6270380.1 hypothetical protein [Sansalvadorimonas sp. 2012CJ34-2]
MFTIEASKDSQLIEKIEDTSISPNGKFTVATGSFSHHPESYDKWPLINRLVYWADNPSQMMTG